jgi:hypothetical protein
MMTYGNLLPLTITYPAMLLDQCSVWALVDRGRNPCMVRTGGILMSTHDAEYFRQRRRAQGNPARDPFSAPSFQQRATERQRLEQLPWPTNMFGELSSIAELMAEPTHAGKNADGECSCGYRKGHKRNVPQALRNPFGRGFDVVCVASEACKSRWNQARGRREVRLV